MICYIPGNAHYFTSTTAQPMLLGAMTITLKPNNFDHSAIYTSLEPTIYSVITTVRNV